MAEAILSRAGNIAKPTVDLYEVANRICLGKPVSREELVEARRQVGQDADGRYRQTNGPIPGDSVPSYRPFVVCDCPDHCPICDGSGFRSADDWPEWTDEESIVVGSGPSFAAELARAAFDEAELAGLRYSPGHLDSEGGPLW